MTQPDQKKAPLLDALLHYNRESNASFCVPAHHKGLAADPALRSALGDPAFALDRTESEGLDDLHAPSGVIAEAQQLAAKVWGSAHCFFLVNGSTSGNEAMLLSLLRPGDKVLLDRTAHTSVLSALFLTGAEPVWLFPEPLSAWRLPGPQRAEAVRAALEKDPAIRAVFLTSPNYYGICSPLRQIVGAAHEKGVPVLVDEAHGAHLLFSEQEAYEAVRAGADLVVQSLHKTGGSLTQSSLLHVQGPLVSPERVKECVRMLTSSSPSYLLMASLDAARRQLAVHGNACIHAAEEKTAFFRDGLSRLPGVRVLSAEDLPAGGALDPLRLTCTVQSTGRTGIEWKEALYQKSRISIELADEDHLVLLVSWGTQAEEIDLFLQTAQQWNAESGEPLRERDGGGTRTEPFPVPEIACTPREAQMAEADRIFLEDACGRIAAEQITPYPPGVPFLYPGERIRNEHMEQLRRWRDKRRPMHGLQDPTLQTIRVIR